MTQMQPNDPTDDPELDRMAVTSEDEYERGADEEADEVSIDDALETDRVAAEGPESRNADGYGFDTDRDRGGDDVTAAEQGNREEDRMEAETAEEELPEF